MSPLAVCNYVAKQVTKHDVSVDLYEDLTYKVLYQEKLEEARPKVTINPAVQHQKDRQVVIKRARVSILDTEEPEDQGPEFQPNTAGSRQSRPPKVSYYGQPGPVSSRVDSASMYTLDQTEEEVEVEMVQLSRKEADSFVNNMGRYNPEKNDPDIFLKRFKSKIAAQQFNNAETCFLLRYTLNDEDAVALNHHKCMEMNRANEKQRRIAFYAVMGVEPEVLLSDLVVIKQGPYESPERFAERLFMYFLECERTAERDSKSFRQLILAQCLLSIRVSLKLHVDLDCISTKLLRKMTQYFALQYTYNRNHMLC
ncbi:hypothetical protein AOLI_G00241450 [Acnodon oligacanthus]